MSQENVEVVREQFAATNERDVARAMSYTVSGGKIVRAELYPSRAEALAGAGPGE